MFDKLEDLLIRFEELMSELSEPDVANDPVRFRKLMKEQSDLNINSANRTSRIPLLCLRKSLMRRCASLRKKS